MFTAYHLREPWVMPTTLLIGVFTQGYPAKRFQSIWISLIIHTLQTVVERLQRERDPRARLAVLDERTRLARELHDTVAHGVSVMVINAAAAEPMLDNIPTVHGTAYAWWRRSVNRRSTNSSVWSAFSRATTPRAPSFRRRRSRASTSG